MDATTEEGSPIQYRAEAKLNSPPNGRLFGKPISGWALAAGALSR
jgi:hypothetical protein